MSARFDSIPSRRAIVDRRALAERLREIEATTSDAPARRAQAVALLREALKDGRAELKSRIAVHGSRGSELAASYAFLTDQLLRLIFDFATQVLYPLGNPTSAERMTLVAVGGYGRGEMAPFSDVDIMFLTPWKQTPWGEQVIETMLYMLWDLGLKVGQSSRSLDEMVGMAKGDLTIRTALLESRYVWGDQALYDEAAFRFRARGRRRHPRARSSPRSLPSATSATSGWATAAMSSSPTSRRARAAFAISTRSSGSANTSTRSKPSTASSKRAC